MTRSRNTSDDGRPARTGRRRGPAGRAGRAGRETNTAADTGAPDLRPRRRLWFTLAALAIPVLFFAALEAGLRLAGFGGHPPLFVPVESYPRYMQPSNQVARRYFHATQSLPTIPHDSFKSARADSTFRIVVQGGSSAAGYPFYFGGSISDLLEQRLLQTYPGWRIEVVGTAMAAVNSYTLLDLADEVVAAHPDAVVIYAGHNEFYGALGVGSAESVGRSPALVRLYLRLSRFRTVQALRGLLAAVASIGQPDITTSGTLMEQVVRDQSIPLGSPIYRAGLAQFESNLARLLDRYRDEGIAVFVSTVASNERDHAPFVSSARSDSAERQQAALMTEARHRAEAGDHEGALRFAEQAIHADSTAAAPFFVQGRLLEATGQPARARRAYLAAKDRDQLRFRAPEPINDIVRRQAQRSGATLVDGQAALVDASDGGIIGGSLMTEHLHPTIHGYFLLADAFYRALMASESVPAGGRFVDTATARDETLATEVDSLVGQLRVRQLMASWPFRPRGTIPTTRDTLTGPTTAERLANDVFLRRRGRTGALRALRQHHLESGEFRGALRASLALVQRYPYRGVHYFEAGAVLLQGGQPGPALAYAEAGLEREESADGRRLAGITELQLNRVPRAIGHLDLAVAANDNDLEARYWRALALATAGRLDEAARDTERLLSVNPTSPRALVLAERIQTAQSTNESPDMNPR